MARPRATQKGDRLGLEADVQAEVQAPKGPKYIFEFAQVTVTPEPVVLVAKRGVEKFNPNTMVCQISPVAAARENGELAHFVNLPPVQVRADELDTWMEDYLPGVLLQEAQNFEEQEAEEEEANAEAVADEESMRQQRKAMRVAEKAAQNGDVEDDG